MRKVICVPFAFEEGMNSGVNISKNLERVGSYLKNACVSLVSAKRNNPDCCVVLATNLEKDLIPNEFQIVLRQANVEIKYIPFDYFRFPSTYKWALAFYKLCVLKYLVNERYDFICYLDADTYVQNKVSAIWEEANQYILLFDVNHGLNTKEYVDICREFSEYYQEKQLITHYGGEFFCSNLENAKTFVGVAEEIYSKMIEQSFETTKGDEFIISVAANSVKTLVKNASPYINRFWTGVRFRLVSDCYENNPVVILHMPAEKERGIIKLYEKFVKHNKIPKRRTVWKICRLNGQPFIDRVMRIVMKP